MGKRSGLPPLGEADCGTKKDHLVYALSDATEIKDDAASHDKLLRNASFWNKYLGCWTRYRFGEVLWGFFPLAYIRLMERRLVLDTCIGGCLWQIANFNQGPDPVRRIRVYWTLFGTMFNT